MAFAYDLKTDIRFLEGREEGREETIYTNVLNMYKKKMDFITIAEIANITEQKVIEIINKHTKK